ncbi:hypothetical protein QBC37DRAFT_165585 [Rhypophila decipiens]|uniref:Uncharacterized protein n=1 Tax=Rhypophila decipiens TaxID=261697 RepID=A0AAN6YGP4_9PEZI|nr:hypothetical protein QBC37DRAFT_165585 [Rhypophila decipiens]
MRRDSRPPSDTSAPIVSCWILLAAVMPPVWSKLHSSPEKATTKADGNTWTCFILSLSWSCFPPSPAFPPTTTLQRNAVGMSIRGSDTTVSPLLWYLGPMESNAQRGLESSSIISGQNVSNTFRTPAYWAIVPHCRYEASSGDTHLDIHSKGQYLRGSEETKTASGVFSARSISPLPKDVFTDDRTEISDLCIPGDAVPAR